MSLPGEEQAYWVLHSPLTTASEKAAASVKLGEIAEIKRRNAEGHRAYMERQRAAQRPACCPSCGAALTKEGR